MIYYFLQLKDNPTMLAIYGGAFLIAIIVALTFHEYAHAKVAYNCGDDTAYLAGRMKLNPLVHLDLMGSLCLFLFGFGWAKPVPINPLKFKEYRKGTFLTCFAGVLMNFVICFFACGLYVLCAQLFIPTITSEFGLYAYSFLEATLYLTATINLSLCLFNLLPFYPLDGFNILQSVTKGTNKVVNFLRNYGNLILIGLLVVGEFTGAVDSVSNFVITYIFNPIMSFWSKAIIGGF